MSARQFRFQPEAARVADFTRRLVQARQLPSAQDPQGHLGIAPVQLARLASHLRSFDWHGFTARINQHPAFLTRHACGELHFVHARSQVPGALPLLLLHGWPGSFLEFRELVTPLTTAAPAFHVVCPSLPGYGFSTRSLERTCNAAAMADVMAHLMSELGYARFVVQGGDWGSIIGSELARRHAERCLGLHLNLAPFHPPPAGDPLRAAVEPSEAEWLPQNVQLLKDGMGYYAQQSTRPQTLAVALADSPLGLLAWLAEKYLAWSDTDASGASLVSDAAIADQVALYWMTDSIGTSVRLYYDEAHHPAVQSRIEVPTAVAVFPRELIRNPRAWVAARCNLVHWSVQPRGGHFAALEVPQLLLEDLRHFVTQITPARA
jgi:pimeloyl-ACP methyl ester carboxylesterase